MSTSPAQPLVHSAPAQEGRKVQKVVLPGQTPDGQHLLAVLVKRSYVIAPGRRCVPAEADQKLIAGDTHYGDPRNTSVRYEADFCPYKLATDVVFHGKAYAPQGKPVRSLTASLQVGHIRKEVRVIGDRVCYYRAGGNPGFSDPAPFTVLELRYERAYGGVDIYSDPKVPCAYARNPLGCGFAVTPARKAIDNLPLPNIEDPKDLLTPARLCPGHFMHWERQPIPQGFGWFCKYWQPRAALAGVMPADRAVEQELRQVYAQALPPGVRKVYAENKLPGMNFRFFNGASPGLEMPFLSGDEQIRLTHLSPEGEITFQLPGDRPRIGLDIGDGMQEPGVVLHTLMIRMEDRQLDLVWRAAAHYPGPDWLPQMRKLEVRVQ
jgi:hypothetical protein